MVSVGRTRTEASIFTVDQAYNHLNLDWKPAVNILSEADSQVIRARLVVVDSSISTPHSRLQEEEEYSAKSHHLNSLMPECVAYIANIPA